ncbi:MAG: antA/AntB antirepressor family protein [Pseudomonadota bacterium]|tara:strand:- start:883 stop:1173 length:291 start_codon:yes stop_codon:yes gene_type:complete
MIDARALHEWLKVRDPFHQWMQRRIETYGFAEPEDFCTVLFKTRGRPRTDYLITIDMAKELSMVERTEKGRATRPTGGFDYCPVLGKKPSGRGISV